VSVVVRKLDSHRLVLNGTKSQLGFRCVEASAISSLMGAFDQPTTKSPPSALFDRRPQRASCGDFSGLPITCAPSSRTTAGSRGLFLLLYARHIHLDGRGVDRHANAHQHADVAAGSGPAGPDGALHNPHRRV
jgi:hypothetical protein